MFDRLRAWLKSTEDSWHSSEYPSHSVFKTPEKSRFRLGEEAMRSEVVRWHTEEANEHEALAAAETDALNASFERSLVIYHRTSAHAVAAFVCSAT